MLISQIAVDELLERNIDLFFLVSDMNDIMNPGSSSKSQNIIEAASWPDDIRSLGFDFTGNWHFYDSPINQEGLYLVLDEIQSKYNSLDILDRAIFELKKY